MYTLLASNIIGKISPPPGTVPTASDPGSFVGGFLRASIYLLVIVAFVLGFIWLIFAGYGFIFAGDDSKKVASSWSKIYWILIGFIIILGAFAIIRLAEGFFDIKIISGGFNLPTIK